MLSGKYSGWLTSLQYIRFGCSASPQTNSRVPPFCPLRSPPNHTARLMRQMRARRPVSSRPAVMRTQFAPISGSASTSVFVDPAGAAYTAMYTVPLPRSAHTDSLIEEYVPSATPNCAAVSG